MFSTSAEPVQAIPSEKDLNDALRVLGAVVEQLSERVELLETRENIRNAAGSL